MGKNLLWKGDKVEVLEGEFKGQEALVCTKYNWGLMGVLIFDGTIPRRLLWLNENQVRKLKEDEIKNKELKKAR